MDDNAQEDLLQLDAPPKDNEKRNQPTLIDDLPIPVSKPKTFEQLLEEEMRKGNGGGIVAEEQTSPSRQKQTGTAVASKKQFLRRKTQYKGIPSGRP